MGGGSAVPIAVLPRSTAAARKGPGTASALCAALRAELAPRRKHFGAYEREMAVVSPSGAPHTRGVGRWLRQVPKRLQRLAVRPVRPV